MAYRRCNRFPQKRQYPTEAKARKAADWMHTLYPTEAFGEYKCRDCRLWHVGRYPARLVATAEEIEKSAAAFAASHREYEARQAKKQLVRDLGQWENEGGAIAAR